MLLAFAATGSGLVGARSGGPPAFGLERHTIDGGGGASAGGGYFLIATIGQHDAAPTPSIGGPYSLSGGFWASGSTSHLFADGFEG
ncbi:hypothetical protein [Halomonas denitrificans]|nr:hypothetical protein [Halomonas denitrificans]